MALFNRNKIQIQEMITRTKKLESEVIKYRENQEFLVNNILALEEYSSKHRGNDYTDYATAVQSISDKYNNIAEWGCIETSAVIDLRASFILGEGIKVSTSSKKKADAENELKWTNDFLQYNGLDAEMAQEIAKEAEIEGKIALKIVYEEAKDGETYRGWPGMISVRYISWSEKKYIVDADPNDYLWYKTLRWRPKDKLEEETLPESSFVYKKFGGRVNEPNTAQPKIMKCLTQIDRLDKALWDLRRINHLFASPTPDVECANAEDVKTVKAQMTDVNWKIGKGFVHTGHFSFKGPDSQGIDNLIAEIEMCIKMISGTTGIPIHFLGLLDLLKNRATGDNTRELVMAATSREREIWRGAYEETIEKAMTMFNEKVNAQKSDFAKLDPTKIKVDIPQVTQEQWDRIEKVLIPAKIAGIISPEFVASQIPGVDQEEETNQKTQATENDMVVLQKQIDLARAKSTQISPSGDGTGIVQ